MIDKYKDNFSDFLNNLLQSADINIKKWKYKKEQKNINELPIEQRPFIVNPP
ncbi:MAG: hypothetical protein LBC61_03405 [Candidatus Peribacteria bacterium]|jgi:hypothetical protein|nr:hypothetical protein [Candidatus Peribacteria bacterium]